MGAGQGASNRARGRFGEDVAVRYLGSIGITVIDRNWRSPSGELDVVALEGGVLVVCEVKTRSTEAFGGPLAAVTPVKLARLRRLAGEWIAEHPLAVDGLRIDVIGVMCPPRGATDISHLRAVG
ncbi:MAG: YraN family protein [Actinomycetes bacterium]